MTAVEVQVGDVLTVASGSVVVLRRAATHGGVELLVRPQAGTATRLLWFWPGQAILGKASSKRQDTAGRVGRAEATRRQHRARNVAQGQAGRHGKARLGLTRMSQ